MNCSLRIYFDDIFKVDHNESAASQNKTPLTPLKTLKYFSINKTISKKKKKNYLNENQTVFIIFRQGENGNEEERKDK